MEAKYSGQCLCGAITYSINQESVFSGNCHCTSCQKSSGSAYAPAMIFPEKAVTIHGNVTSYSRTADSGGTHQRGFCPTCGSQLFSWFSNMPGMLGVKAGTLQDPSRYIPKLDFHVKSAAPWDFMDPKLPKKQGAAQD